MNYPFDIEIYKNFFSMICKNPYTGKEYVFFSFEDKDCRPRLRKFLSLKPTLIGFNSYSFDIPVLVYYLDHALLETYDFAQMIINSDYHDRKPKEYYDCRDRSGINGIDLMRVLSIDYPPSKRKSLKQCGITIKWEKIQELPIDPHLSIDKKQVPELIEYNKNDVRITSDLYLKSLNDIELRRYILDEYRVDVFNKSESGIANELMTQLYSRKSGISPLIFREQRTNSRADILNVSDCIGKNIKFVSNEMIEFYDEFKLTTFDRRDKDSLDISFMYQGNKFNVGLGGLHTIDDSGIFESGEKQLIHGDVKSNYPAIILLNKIKPEHLHDKFLEVYEDIVRDRIGAKENNEHLKAYALKIVINSVFGKMNHDSFWLYDPLSFYSVTISGQLYLLSLVDLMEFNGIDVISANTDGIIVYTDKVDLFYRLSEEWQDYTGMGLDYDRWSKYVRRDGNNYLAVDEFGKIKTTGIFTDITDENMPFSQKIKRQFRYPIVTKALHNFFIDKKPVEETIRNHTSLYDFTFVQKPGKKFKVYFDGEEVQHINRIYISNTGGRLYKVDGSRKLSVVNDEVSLANDIVDDSIPDDLDYDFYIKEANKIVWKIQPPVKQERLF